MFKRVTTMVVAVSLLVGQAHLCLARGGGGFHGGGGGFHGGGGFGGYRGGFRGDRPGGFDNFRPMEGQRPANFDSFGRGAGFDRAAARPAFDGSRTAGDRPHGNLPSDFGFGHVGPKSYLPTGHATHGWSRNEMRDRARTVRNNFWNHNYFDRNWWRDHPGAWFAAGWAAGTAWAWTTWPALGGWYGWGDVQPIYYNYGENVVYDGDNVYYGDQQVGSADQFYQQASDIAANAPQTSDDEGQWTPLGVFGLVQGEQASASAVFQLATSKSGAIGGNFCDMLTGNTLQVHGSVDKQTQRAAWTVGDNKDTVYEAGIYNLTQEQLPLLVHFGKDRTQQWMLVRLKQPEQAAQPTKPQ